MKTLKIIIDGKEIKTIKVNDQDVNILLKIIGSIWGSINPGNGITCRGVRIDLQDMQV